MTGLTMVGDPCIRVYRFSDGSVATLIPECQYGIIPLLIEGYLGAVRCSFDRGSREFILIGETN